MSGHTPWREIIASRSRSDPAAVASARRELERAIRAYDRPWRRLARHVARAAHLSFAPPRKT